MQVPDHMTAIRNAHSKAGVDSPLARVLLADESEQAINNQINVEYTNCYLYHSMACYFSRDTVALHGFAAYFRDQSDDERRHAQLFMDFLSKRGGRVTLGALSAPPNVRSAPHCRDFIRAPDCAQFCSKVSNEKPREHLLHTHQSFGAQSTCRHTDNRLPATTPFTFVRRSTGPLWSCN